MEDFHISNYDDEICDYNCYGKERFKVIPHDNEAEEDVSYRFNIIDKSTRKFSEEVLKHLNEQFYETPDPIKETVKMMRDLGLNKYENSNFHQQKEGATTNTKEKFLRNGYDRNFFIFLDESYFKFKIPKEPLTGTSSNSSDVFPTSSTQDSLEGKGSDQNQSTFVKSKKSRDKLYELILND